MQKSKKTDHIDDVLSSMSLSSAAAVASKALKSTEGKLQCVAPLDYDLFPGFLAQDAEAIASPSIFKKICSREETRRDEQR